MIQAPKERHRLCRPVGAFRLWVAYPGLTPWAMILTPLRGWATAPQALGDSLILKRKALKGRQIYVGPSGLLITRNPSQG